MKSKLVALARQVLSSFSIQPSSIRIIQSGGMKTVWKIASPQGSFCLKRLRHPIDKVHFSIQAQHFLASKKANVPAIIKTKEGNLYVENNAQVFVLYEWIPGKNLNFSNLVDLKKAVEGLAKFHQSSKGFLPPISCTESTKWGRWPHHYESMLNRFKVWRDSKRFPSVANIFRAYVDDMIKQGEKALQLLEQSYYPQWISGNVQKGLCHQDYGEGNALLTKNGVVLLDLDGATYDLPLRDLRKIILKRMSTKGKWDPALIEKVISWYSAIHPLTSAQITVLYIDLLFPHEFHDTAKNPFHKGKSISPSKLLAAAKLEKSKAKHLLRQMN